MQEGDEGAPGVLGCVVVGMMSFDEWAREWRHVELRQRNKAWSGGHTIT